jgi:hypothetical protein
MSRALPLAARPEGGAKQHHGIFPMQFRARALRALAAGWLFALAGLAQAAPSVDFRGVQPSPAARQMAQRALAGDAAGKPFAVVDKAGATLYVFNARGRLVGASPALLGLMPGDTGVPGLGKRPLAAIRPHERITPSGRYDTEPGINLEGEPVVWFDYDEGLAIHRVRPGPTHEQRLQRLASDTPDDNRISLGCVVVPVAFYEQVVATTLGRRAGVVYVLPEAPGAADRSVNADDL